MHIYTGDVIGGDLPGEMYHPGGRDREPLPGERGASEIARRLQFALVVVEFDHGDWRNCFEPDPNLADVKTRWSVGSNQKLYTPLYVGYGAGTWFFLRPTEDTKPYWKKKKNTWTYWLKAKIARPHFSII
ncbi:Hypothetical predicted protein [Lecanosticta acicola]|uniref:Uncharacterized protein n=1 Tax=Lecanosticta acicola TaxID=111012 RepID=A0AAI8Z6G6_9PEZI|nr:Hypothetical predicted protein [Lecanosticta acicola]